MSRYTPQEIEQIRPVAAKLAEHENGMVGSYLVNRLDSETLAGGLKDYVSYDKLQKIKALKDSGKLSDAEFQQVIFVAQRENTVTPDQMAALTGIPVAQPAITSQPAPAALVAPQQVIAPQQPAQQYSNRLPAMQLTAPTFQPLAANTQVPVINAGKPPAQSGGYVAPGVSNDASDDSTQSKSDAGSKFNEKAGELWEKAKQHPTLAGLFTGLALVVGQSVSSGKFMGIGNALGLALICAAGAFLLDKVMNNTSAEKNQQYNQGYSPCDVPNQSPRFGVSIGAPGLGGGYGGGLPFPPPPFHGR